MRATLLLGSSKQSPGRCLLYSCCVASQCVHKLFTVLCTFLWNLKIKWAIDDGYGTFTELDWVVESGGNAFRKTHGGRSLWEILKASRVESSRTLNLHCMCPCIVSHV